MDPNLINLRRLAIGGLAVVGASFLLVVLFLGYCAYTLPLTRPQATEIPPAAVIYANAAGVPFAARGVFHGERITADHLPKNLVNAVIAIEDRRFYSHGAIDMRGILRAGWHNLWHRGVEGGSTITQQLARLTFLSTDRSLRRKVQEAMLAIWLESRLSKQEILARYLNSVYFGAGAVGADAAAKRYFGKKAEELDIAEAAMLAGLIRAPSQLSPSRNLAAARARAKLVLDAMLETGAIGRKDAEAARAEPVKLAVPPETEPDDNYFVDTADAEIKRLIGAAPLDLSVTTTFDPRLQDAADRVVKRWLDGEGAQRHAGQAALVALAPDGAILAMVGGRDYGESQFNRATQAKRQPGSLFKIFVYLTALANGYTPDSVVVDQPVQIGDWQPKNYDGKFRGPVTLRTAFAQSINTVSAQLVQALGPERVAAMAKSLGVQSELPPVPSLALGSAEVTLLDMTRAMDEIATDSKAIEPYAIRSIRTQAAQLYNRPEAVSERPDWQPAWAPMMRLLEAVVSEGTGKAAHLDRRSAGKTGTTDEYRDAWFVGFTTDLVVGVWVGNDDNSPMDQVAGGDLPAKIWHDFVTDAERIMATPNAPAPAAAEAGLTGATAPTPTAAAAPAAPPAQAASPAASLASPANAAPAPPRAETLRGVPLVIDSGTLLLDGVTVHLGGIEGQPGEPAQQLVQYIGGRPVECQSAASGNSSYRCKLGEYDLGEAVLLNGAGRAAPDAPEQLRGAEQQARAAGRGIWRR